VLCSHCRQKNLCIAATDPFAIQNPNAVYESNNVALNYNINQNYSNPFDGETTIQFTLPQREHAVLNIYDLRGALIATVLDAMLLAGANNVQFNSMKCSCQREYMNTGKCLKVEFVQDLCRW